MTEPKNDGKADGWRSDEFAAREVLGNLFGLVPILFAIIVFLAATLLPALSRAKAQLQRQVVAYCAQDQVYAEPIFGDFEKETGIRVRAIYDNEAVKTVGLANRILAERNHPQCDLFWGNEEMRTRQLATQNVWRESNGWAAFGYRSRRMVINPNLLKVAAAPKSLFDLTNAVWCGKVALAYPQFGTTATHFHALRQYWGDAAWKTWCRALAANKPFLVDGNSMVVKTVAQGQALVGLTDSDDIADAQREGLNVAPLPMNSETLLIPNTAAITRGAPHAEAAERLFEYLQTRAVVDRLISAKALEGVSSDRATIPTLKVDWSALLRDLEPTTEKLNQIFLR